MLCEQLHDPYLTEGFQWIYLDSWLKIMMDSNRLNCLDGFQFILKDKQKSVPENIL